ncbi:Ig-like domain-containing protein [Chryseobacterium sp. FH1]|uniref:Ig-like domain-containing protein n=1 Tax=Chryseobacterium sp. FH1 TaxID=1233951 RepID=UPI0013F3BDE5|nr:Ig-like domain-containing protein [Chryseobacterium sp. FH1]
MLLWLLLFGQLHAQVWEPVGTSTGISTGVAGRLTLVNDFQNKLIVGYFDADALKGSVQKFDGTSWSYVGGSPGITPSFTTYNSTSVDSNGIIYFTNQAAYPATGMEVRKFENNAWTQLPNMTNAGINFNTSAISSDNTLFAANNENSGTVKKLVNGVWQQVGATGFTGGVPYFLDMVIGTNGKIYVSFNNNGNLHVYENDVNASSTTAWQPVGGIANLAPAPNIEDYNSSIAIDSNNHLFVAYVSAPAGGNKLNVKKFDGSTWSQLGAENFSQYRTKHTSIAIGANDIVYVAVSKWEDEDMLRNFVFAYNETTNSWAQAGTGFASEGQGIYNSLAVDSFGNLFLAFADSGLGKLSVKKLNLAVVAAESIEITTENNVPAEIIQDNGTLQLKAAVFPEAASQNVVWSMFEGGTFATVSNTGLVTAIASDAVVSVKATSLENSSIFKTFAVTLKNQNSDIAPQSISLKTANGSNADIFTIGGTLQLKAEVTPLEADQKVNWTVQQGAGVASVSTTGLVTGLQEGFAIVRATHLNGTLFGEIRINVFKSGCGQGNETILSGFGYGISNNIINSADDFVVAQGTRFNLSTLRMNILHAPGNLNNSYTIKFLKNDNGAPGELIKEVVNVVPSSKKFIQSYGDFISQYEIELNLPESLAFDQGTYWIMPVANTSQEVYWDTTPEVGGIGSDYHFDNFDGNGWRKLGQGGFDAIFDISGNCTPMPVVISTLSGSNAEVFIGETLQMKAVVNAQGLSQNVNWTLESGSDFASINNGGLVTGVKAGFAVVKATSVDDSNLFTTFEVSVLDPNACNREAVSNGIEDAFLLNGATDQRLAVDFEVEAGSFTINSVEPSVANFATSFSFAVLKDENGLPGEEIAFSNGKIVHDLVTGVEFDFYFHRYIVNLDSPIKLPKGKYWLEMRGDALAWEATSADIQGQPAAFYNANTNAWGLLGNGEFVYKINGVCLAEDLGVNDIDNKNLSYYPNPVKDILNISADEKLVNVAVYNMVGQKVLGNSLNESKVKVNVAGLLTGTYIVEATTVDGKVKRFKIIKN